MTSETERQIARDLALCELGLAMTRGRARRKFVRQRAACLRKIKRMNEADGLDQVSDAELLRELFAGPEGDRGTILGLPIEPVRDDD